MGAVKSREVFEWDGVDDLFVWRDVSERLERLKTLNKVAPLHFGKG
jgi:hypothetical protein